MSIKINSFEAENVKRIKAVLIEPTAAGLTIIGGKNGQGKTSVLDSITWALGGDKYRPSEPRRDGSALPPSLHIKLSNGLIVERKGKNSDLKVVDPSGNKAGQKLLDSFISTFALDLPKFIEQSNKEKAKTLLQIIGVGDRLYELDDQEAKLYSQRTEIGRIADQKKSAADEMDSYPDAPEEIVSASELISQQQDILARNGENQRLRNNVDQVAEAYLLQDKLCDDLEDQLRGEKWKLAKLADDLKVARKSAQDLKDESTEELEKNISEVDEINRKVRVNLDKARVVDESNQYSAQYDDLSGQIDAIRAEKMALLNGADLPLPGLSVADGELTYKGYKWDNMSGSEQLKVAAAIVRKLNPECGFVLLDKLEAMDLDTLNDFGKWLEAEDLQAIATRVSTGDECSVIIEDGYISGQDTPAPAEPKEGGGIQWN